MAWIGVSLKVIKSSGVLRFYYMVFNTKEKPCRIYEKAPLTGFGKVLCCGILPLEGPISLPGETSPIPAVCWRPTSYGTGDEGTNPTQLGEKTFGEAKHRGKVG